MQGSENFLNALEDFVCVAIKHEVLISDFSLGFSRCVAHVEICLARNESLVSSETRHDVV